MCHLVRIVTSTTVAHPRYRILQPTLTRTSTCCQSSQNKQFRDRREVHAATWVWYVWRIATVLPPRSNIAVTAIPRASVANAVDSVIADQR
ncbi:hypothetical protein GMOD_00001039 [Pyrenophora seminiperda CCB06]|uniref:Uncharacterized protein n=1 Tax=Pyrenophora seminiperda CCB06 TaxID=1302712 RepID=A0A3M7LY37_9PLEO|nr:hypothetical protein GMOD_00001039 [Pyrenophora seminiperda CCB06]